MITTPFKSIEGKVITISDDLSMNLQKDIAKNCANLTDKCVQSVKNSVSSPNTELETRKLGIRALVVLSQLIAAVPIASSYSSGSLS